MRKTNSLAFLVILTSPGICKSSVHRRQPNIPRHASCDRCAQHQPSTDYRFRKTSPCDSPDSEYHKQTGHARNTTDQVHPNTPTLCDQPQYAANQDCHFGKNHSPLFHHRHLTERSPHAGIPRSIQVSYPTSTLNESHAIKTNPNPKISPTLNHEIFLFLIMSMEFNTPTNNIHQPYGQTPPP